MGYWTKHPKKEGEELLEVFDAHGWRITRGKGYYMCWCPLSCGNHHKTVHLSPSNPNHFNEVQRFVQKMPCWRERGLK